jgi:hypothetical protein
MWFDKRTGGRLFYRNLDVLEAKEGLDPNAVPVLLRLLEDPDATVRAFAVEGLCRTSQRYPQTMAEAVPALRKTLSDTAEIDGQIPKPTVGDMARRAILWMEKVPRESPLRGVRYPPVDSKESN